LSSGVLTPYSRLNPWWTWVMGLNFTYHNIVCVFCCTVDIALITQNRQSKLLSVTYSWDKRTTHVSETEFTITPQVPTPIYICFPYSAAGVWNRSNLFDRHCILHEKQNAKQQTIQTM
jgi:hypothetical protein